MLVTVLQPVTKADVRRARSCPAGAEPPSCLQNLAFVNLLETVTMPAESGIFAGIAGGS
jgi:hypothetical protein